jgi:hypothetical protein
VVDLLRLGRLVAGQCATAVVHRFGIVILELIHLAEDVELQHQNPALIDLQHLRLLLGDKLHQKFIDPLALPQPAEVTLLGVHLQIDESGDTQTTVLHLQYQQTFIQIVLNAFLLLTTGIFLEVGSLSALELDSDHSVDRVETSEHEVGQLVAIQEMEITHFGQTQPHQHAAGLDDEDPTLRSQQHKFEPIGHEPHILDFLLHVELFLRLLSIGSLGIDGLADPVRLDTHLEPIPNVVHLYFVDLEVSHRQDNVSKLRLDCLQQILAVTTELGLTVQLQTIQHTRGGSFSLLALNPPSIHQIQEKNPIVAASTSGSQHFRHQQPLAQTVDCLESTEVQQLSLPLPLLLTQYVEIHPLRSTALKIILRNIQMQVQPPAFDVPLDRNQIYFFCRFVCLKIDQLCVFATVTAHEPATTSKTA